MFDHNTLLLMLKLQLTNGLAQTSKFIVASYFFLFTIFKSLRKKADPNLLKVIQVLAHHTLFQLLNHARNLLVKSL